MKTIEAAGSLFPGRSVYSAPMDQNRADSIRKSHHSHGAGKARMKVNGQKKASRLRMRETPLLVSSGHGQNTGLISVQFHTLSGAAFMTENNEQWYT